MEGGVLEYPDLFNIVIFKVRADLVKMDKISKFSPFWRKVCKVVDDYL